MNKDVFRLWLYEELYKIAHNDKVETAIYAENDPSGLATSYVLDIEGLQRLLYDKLLDFNLKEDQIVRLRRDEDGK